MSLARIKGSSHAVVEIAATDKHIVDLADRAGACYRAERKKGCCHGCVVEIDGEQGFACKVPPAPGMNIVVVRADLNAVRRKNRTTYNQGVKTGNHLKCSGAGSCPA